MPTPERPIDDTLSTMHTRAEPTAIKPPGPLEDVSLASWRLDPEVTFLNHGSFGARPQEVLAAQTRWRETMESRPVEFFDRRRAELVAAAKAVVGRFLGMASADFGFITNATGGVNAVLRSRTFRPGEEIVSTTHVYNAVRQTMRYVAERTGAVAREIEVPFPVASPHELVAAIDAGLTDRTTLLILDHVSSPTAVVFPVAEITELCAARGIELLIDGAHAPGMLPLDVAAIGAAYYTGNLHKWVSAPPGAAFLWVHPDRQPSIHPNTISHHLGEGLASEFEWQGTRDVTPWLSVPAAIDFFASIGWDRVMSHNHQLATWAQQHLCARWGVTPATPLDGSMLGSMATVALPQDARRFSGCAELQRAIFDCFRIEVPVVDWGGGWWVRVSCHVYNRAEDYERLAEAVIQLLQ